MSLFNNWPWTLELICCCCAAKCDGVLYSRLSINLFHHGKQTRFSFSIQSDNILCEREREGERGREMERERVGVGKSLSDYNHMELNWHQTQANCFPWRTWSVCPARPSGLSSLPLWKSSALSFPARIKACLSVCQKRIEIKETG